MPKSHFQTCTLDVSALLLLLLLLLLQNPVVHSSAAPTPKQQLPQVPIPALAGKQQPNFIVILTDDQGWDDIGLHNPKYVNTPNIDRSVYTAAALGNSNSSSMYRKRPPQGQQRYLQHL
jgi:hypothetical protein